MIGSMKPFWGSFTTPRTLSVDQYSGEKVLASQPINAGAGSKPIFIEGFECGRKT